MRISELIASCPSSTTSIFIRTPPQVYHTCSLFQFNTLSFDSQVFLHKKPEAPHFFTKGRSFPIRFLTKQLAERGVFPIFISGSQSNYTRYSVPSSPVSFCAVVCPTRVQSRSYACRIQHGIHFFPRLRAVVHTVDEVRMIIHKAAHFFSASWLRL